MTRGRKPKPTVLKLVTNNAGNRPLPTNEPKPASRDLQAPPILLPDARAEWDRVASDLVASGLVTVADLASLAIYCTAFGRWVQAERLLAAAAQADPATEGLMVETASGNLIQNPLLGIRNKAAADLKAKGYDKAVMIVNISGRGDKDMATAGKWFGYLTDDQAAALDVTGAHGNTVA